MDPADLCRVFEDRGREPSPRDPSRRGLGGHAPRREDRRGASNRPRPRTSPRAFAALQAELKTLLGPLAEHFPNRPGKDDAPNAEELTNDLADEDARLASDLAAEKAKCSARSRRRCAALAEKLETLRRNQPAMVATAEGLQPNQSFASPGRVPGPNAAMRLFQFPGT